MMVQVGQYRGYINALLQANDMLLTQLRAGNVPGVTVQFFINQLPPDMFPSVTVYLKNIFSLVCSSAASERNFSTHAFIHSKLRNRLKYEKVKMLVYIFVNSRLLDDIPEFVGVIDSDDEDDFDEENDNNDDAVVFDDDDDVFYNDLNDVDDDIIE
jgi:hypothetical protein